MDDSQVALVRQSWAKVAPIAPTAATIFYDRLFAVAPGVRGLFPQDISEQKLKLVQMLDTVVEGLGDLDGLVPAVQELGIRHAGYGAAPEHYDVVGECLLWTLAQGLGEEFTPAMRDAWVVAYSTLASVMIAAGEQAAAEAA